MSDMSTVSKMIGSPDGGLVYYGLVLLAVLAAVGMFWGEQRRRQSESARQRAWAFGALFAVRATYALMALVATLTELHLASVLPPMERLVDVASIGFLAWAFLPSATQRARPWQWMVGANLILAVSVYLVFVVFWAQALTGGGGLFYNAFWQDVVWIGWRLALAALAAIAAVRGRGRGRGAFLVTMLVLSAGALLQLTFGDKGSHLQEWQRLASLVAYPLVAVAVYQEIVSGMEVQSLEMQDISQASLDQMKSLLSLFDASLQTSSSLDLSSVLNSAARGVATVLEADQCAIVVPEEDGSETMRLAAIHNPTRQGRGEEVTFPLEYQLKVQQAIRRRKPVIVEDSEDVQLKVLFALMGAADETGPLLVQPLLSGRDAIGAIIAGNSRSQRPFTPSDSKLCQSMAEQVATAIQNARRYQFAQSQVEELAEAQQEALSMLQKANDQIQELAEQLSSAVADVEELEERQQSAREARNALEIHLVSSRAEADKLSERAAALEAELRQAHSAAAGQGSGQEAELERLTVDWERTVAALQSVQSVLRGMSAGVIVSDAEGVVEQANVAAKCLLEEDGGELLGRRIENLFADPDWHTAINLARAGTSSQLTLQTESGALICDLAAVAGVGEDVGENHRVVAVFQPAPGGGNGRAERLDVILSLAHELRSPIIAVNSYADLLLSEAGEALGDSQRKFLTRIKSNAERMKQLTDDLLSETGVTRRLSRPSHEPLDLVELIESAIARAAGQYEDRDLTLEMSVADDLPLIEADPELLQRVLANLLSNACLASADGGRVLLKVVHAPVHPLLEKRQGLDGAGYVVVSVADSGDGLTEEALESVFDQARPSQTPPGLGESGAGLSLARKMIEASGGDLWAESEEGEGTSFSFAVPVSNKGQLHEPVPDADNT